MLATLTENFVSDDAAPVKMAHRAELHIANSILSISREAWNGCFAGEIENYDYLLAVEQASIEDFRWRYLTLIRDGVTVAAMPAFLTDYRLETTVDSRRLRQIVGNIRRYLPRFLSFRLACLGSPCTENGRPGFHPTIGDGERPALFALLLDGFARMADIEGCSLRGIKDVPASFPAAQEAMIGAADYAAIPGLPTAYLDIAFPSLDAYLQGLSSGTRKDMRRKLKSRNEVVIEECTDIVPIIDTVMALYNDTRERSDWQFEELSEAYFTGLMRQMSGRCFCTLFKVDGDILAINLMLHDETVLIDKFFCMRADAGRPYNLYYLSWFYNLDYCLRHGLQRYQSGQAYYENKLRLGSKLIHNMMYFRHRNPIMQRLLCLISPIFSVDDPIKQP